MAIFQNRLNMVAITDGRYLIFKIGSQKITRISQLIKGGKYEYSKRAINGIQ